MVDTQDKVLSICLVLGIFYFGFMNLDRMLSIIYGFNFQPYGEYAPKGFTYWGHLGNGSLAAIALFLTFKLEEVGSKRGNRFIQYSGYAIYAFIGAFIPYMNDTEHLTKNGAANTLLPYILGNDIYVFAMGWLAYRAADSIKKKTYTVAFLGFAFLINHFLFFAPRFPEFYWS
ncbi:hypothetical protein HN807_01310 [Candidatus Bathyarchaeota archaeon]|jgi:hypothetical protein|nr:hypothetical protein [Candidatus Bathyarchaeota archaeon]MBT4319527.1 hypothetical protein [Candidatus Bathyarchaeota archaeon]MBT4422746.1 hypothetical protein [Candidatus Bathyarchaeota archaeon]MBT5642269.1 hypothetical protein [Candidatus Bathyarchaeota archaeon]MBT6603472.1 hypothetical protein [Candidatus Bathyarchaeota archaeon]